MEVIQSKGDIDIKFCFSNTVKAYACAEARLLTYTARQNPCGRVDCRSIGDYVGQKTKKSNRTREGAQLRAYREKNPRRDGDKILRVGRYPRHMHMIW